MTSRLLMGMDHWLGRNYGNPYVDGDNSELKVIPQ
jgi:hypothetical protein